MRQNKRFIGMLTLLVLLTGCAGTGHIQPSAQIQRLSFTSEEQTSNQIMTLADGRQYLGEYNNNLPEGYGKMKLVDGSMYIGTLKKGVPNGFGISHNVDGSIYEGEHVNGLFSGRGKLTFSDGSFFIGYFKNNRVDQGTMVFTNGREAQVR